MKADSVSWMSPAVPCRSTAITGRAGRYMSMLSGVNDDSRASTTNSSGVRVGRTEGEVMRGGSTCYKRTMSMLPELSEPQIRRYARHIVLAEIGGVGQSRLIAA